MTVRCVRCVRCAVCVCVRACVLHCSLCVGIIFVAYALQVKHRPFLDPNLDALHDAPTSDAGLWEVGSRMVYVRAFRSLGGLQAPLGFIVNVQTTATQSPRQ